MKDANMKINVKPFVPKSQPQEERKQMMPPPPM
jgi:hypothetical protein